MYATSFQNFHQSRMMEKYLPKRSLAISQGITGLSQIGDLKKDVQQLKTASTTKYKEPCVHEGFTFCHCRS